MSATTPDTPEAPELIEQFGIFLRRYCSDDIGVLAQHYPKEQRSLAIDWRELHQFDPDLADDYLAYPGEMREYAEEALRNYDLAIDIALAQAHVRVGNLQDEHTYYPGEFSPSKHNNQYRAISGEISKATDVKPKIEEAAFECQRCGTLSYIPQTGSFQEPHECQGCERQGPFRINFDQSEFVDSQKLRLKTPPEIAEGAGQYIDVHVEDDLSGVAQTGDRVTIAGTLHLEDQSSSNSKKSRAFDQYLEGEHIAFEESDPTEETITVDERKEIEAIANGERGDPLTLAGESVAPRIHGHQDEKEALLLAAVAGARNTFSGGDERGDFHVLLIGDPGTSKSKLGNWIADVAPRSVSVDSSHAGTAGLNAAAVQDDFGDGGWVLEAGASVKANDGLLWVDELDDMSPEKRKSLMTPMSEQRINVSKAGINATLSTRCAVVAAANPKYGRFDPYEAIGEQIDLEPPLVSRFDLIFVLTDRPNQSKDAKIADHILDGRDVQKRKQRGLEVDAEVADGVEAPIEKDLLRKWIVLARQQPDPVFANAAVKQQLKDAFVELRGAYGYSDDDPVPVTHRKLPGVVRIAEAVAKLEFSDVITEAHAKTALEKVGRSMRDFGKDEEGNLDADIMETGRSKSQRDKLKLIREAVKDGCAESDDDMVEMDAIVDELGDELGEEYVRDRLDSLLYELGEATEPKRGYIRYLGRR